MKASVFSLAAVVAVAAAAQNGTVPLVTSVILATTTHTILSCAPTVTNCPVGKVTEIVYDYTTICPATAVLPPAPTVTPAPVGPQTVFSTEVFTILSCPATVTNCPVGKVTSGLVLHTSLAPPASTGVAPPPTAVVTSASNVPAPAPTTEPAVPVAVPTTLASEPTPVAQAVPVGTGSPAPQTNTTTPVSPSTVAFVNGASVQNAGSFLMAVGLAAALL